MGPYSAYVENGPARAAKISRQIADLGDLWADGAEVFVAAVKIMTSFVLAR